MKLFQNSWMPSGNKLALGCRTRNGVDINGASLYLDCLLDVTALFAAANEEDMKALFALVAFLFVNSARADVDVTDNISALFCGNAYHRLEISMLSVTQTKSVTGRVIDLRPVNMVVRGVYWNDYYKFNLDSATYNAETKLIILNLRGVGGTPSARLEVKDNASAENSYWYTVEKFRTTTGAPYKINGGLFSYDLDRNVLCRINIL